MTVIHIVLFKFLSTVSTAHKQAFISELRTLKSLPSVLNKRLLVGGPSITDPVEKSKGYELALVSFHQNRKALEDYQTSDEHHRVTSQYLWPYKEDVARFDFEVALEDELVCKAMVNGLIGSLGGEASVDCKDV